MSEVTLVRVLAAGAYIAILPLGALVARRLVAQIALVSPRERIASALALGFGGSSLLYATFVLLHAFVPLMIGGLGWALTAYAGSRLLRERTWDQWVQWLRASRWAVAGTAAMVLALGFVYLGFPYESLLGMRDEAIYTLAALALERNGSLSIVASDVTAVAPELFSPLIDGARFYAPGVYATNDGLVLQFSPLVPAWIAQAHSAFGDIALYRTSGVFAIASSFLFYAIARRLFVRSIAFACVVVFALNPAQVWIARINLAESLGQLFMLSGLWLAMLALKAKSRLIAMAASVLFGLSAFVRLDAVLVAPLMAAAAAIAAVCGGRRSAHVGNVLTALALTTVATQLVAIGALAVATPVYVASNQEVLWFATCATLVGAIAIAFSRSRWRCVIALRSATTILEWTCAITLIALFVYAAWWRPELGQHATISRPGHAWDGQRDWREQSLVNLAAYLGWPTLALALVGAVCIAVRMLRGRTDPKWLLVWTTVVPTAIVILANPRVSPDHFWAIRRFVPLVIPGTILLAGFGLQGIMVRHFQRVSRNAGWAVAVLAGAALLVAQRATLFERENRGITVQLRDLAALTAHAQHVIVRDFDAIATTLLVGYGQPVVPLRDMNTPVNRNARAFWSFCTPQAPCVMVHRDFAGLSGLVLGKTKSLSLTRDYIAPTFSPLPNAMAHETMRILVTPVTGLAPPSDLRLLGGHRDWNVDDSGFYREEFGRDSSWRWTDGDARLALPALDADRLEITLAVPEDHPVRVSIALDRLPLHDGLLAPGSVRLVFPLSGPPVTRQLTILSDTFVPKERGGTLDNRRLGVLVLAVRLLDSTVTRMRRDAVVENYRAKLTVLGRSRESPLAIAPASVPTVTLQIANESNVVWPARGDVKSGETEVALGIKWTTPGDEVPRLEQRVELPFSLHPGERLLLAPPLDSGNLPPGDYEAHIGLVHEDVAWFGGVNGALQTVPVTIPAR
jgi:hypothetical protein